MSAEPSNQSRSELEKMLVAIEHRGPDNQGIWTSKDNCLHFGHRRLSIIDLSEAAHQPMTDFDGVVWITYNGEIYNYRELRQELVKAGHRFRTESDTEVVLNAYKEWGIAAVTRFRGMFAFALWDTRTRSLFLVRDRAGVKPLYYSTKKGTTRFASELKSLYAGNNIDTSIDFSAQMEFFQFGYISAPRTIYESVRCVQPGHYVEIEPGKDAREVKYWDINDYYRKGAELESQGYWHNRREDDIVDEFEELLARGFEYRLVADVPIGLFLSGGIDSSLLAAILAKKLGHSLKTFTIGFREKEFDESHLARRTATKLETDHTELIVDEDTALRTTLNLARTIDEPFGDNSIVPTYLVSKLASESVKVVLSADGADELFTGYSRYWMTDRAIRQPAYKRRMGRIAIDCVSKAIPIRLLESVYAGMPTRGKKRSALGDKILKYRSMLAGSSADDMYNRASSIWQPEELKALSGDQNYERERTMSRVFEELSDCDPITRMMAADFKKYMVGDVLTKVDRASMAVSIEAREPFLDHEMLQFAATLPLRFKYRDGQSKYLLKKVLYRYLPEEWFTQPKQGFASPVGAWLKGPLRDRVGGLKTSMPGIKDNGRINSGYAEKSIDDFYSKGRIGSNQVWLLLQYMLWRENWVDVV